MSGNQKSFRGFGGSFMMPSRTEGRNCNQSGEGLCSRRQFRPPPDHTWWLVLITISAGVAAADENADFFTGKPITIYVGYTAGGGYDT